MSEDGYDHQVERVARGVGVGSAGQGVGRLLGYVTHVAVAWMYGPAQLGFHAVGITVVQVASILSQLGLDNGVVRYVAQHGARGDTARVRGTILHSLAVTLTLSMALWVTQGFGTLKYAAFVGQVARPLRNLALLVVFYLLAVQILGAVAAYVLSMAFGAALALACLPRVFPGLLAGKARELSAALVLANGSSLIFVHRNLGFWPYDRQYARPLLAALVAAVLTLASRALLPHLEGLPALLLFAPLTLAVFFGVLVSLGLYPSDRMLLVSFTDALKGACRREPAR